MPAATPAKPWSFTRRLKEIDLFFEGRGKEHKTLRRVVQNLEKAGIAYAVMGGMAVNAHKYERTTNDVDVLITEQGLDDFIRRFVPKSYDAIPGRPRRILDRRNQVTIDFLVTGLFPGSGKPGPIPFPDPVRVRELIQDIQFVGLPTLIELKLLARRYKDFGDVVELIRSNHLDESFQHTLHQAVHRDYIECLEEKRREDEYERRQDAAVEALRRHKRAQGEE
jgi:hypothetical protein